MGFDAGRRGELVHGIAALERTALAWERTAISLAAVGLLLLKVVDGGALIDATGLVLVGAAILVVLVVVPVGYRRARARVDPATFSAFTEQDRTRPLVLAATAWLVSLTVAAIAVDLWLVQVL